MTAAHLSYDEIVSGRNRYLTPSLRSFTGYAKPFVISRAKGQHVWDHQGKKYLDCLAQNLSISVGHCHPEVVRAVQEQAESCFHCSTMYHHELPVRYAEELLARFPADEDWVVHFVNSGAEANDLALLMARLYTGNYDLIALRNGFHGLHFGAMGMTGISACRQPLPSIPGILHVNNPDQYQGCHGATVEPYLKDLEATIQSSTPGRIAGFLVEPVQGFAGIIPMPGDYMKRAFEIVRAAGGLCIVDEVQTGFGRMGSHFWGFEAHGAQPDIIVMAKGIGNGFPLAAVVARRPVAEAMSKKKFFNTYGSNPMACAAGRAVLRVIDEEELQKRSAELGGFLLAQLRELQRDYAFMGDVRGQGLMVGIEIVSDRHSKMPDSDRTARLGESLLNRGLIMSRSGVNGNVIRINPPMCVTMADMDFILTNLKACFDEA